MGLASIWGAVAGLVLLLLVYLLLLRFSTAAPGQHASRVAIRDGASQSRSSSWSQVAARRRRSQQLAPNGERGERGPWTAPLPPMSHYYSRATQGPFPIKLRYPLLWSGALFSKSGYGTEAVSYVASLLQLGLVVPEDVWVSQSGDHVHNEVLRTMDPGLLKLLQDHHYHNMTARLPRKQAERPLISVCHSFPDCWRTPADDDPWNVPRALKRLRDLILHTVLRRPWRDNGCPCPPSDIKGQVVYRVGRSMFETEQVPRPVAAYAQFVDEVWVPSEFNRKSFALAGVRPSKLHTLAQGINTTLFNPELQPPIDLSQLRGSLVAGRPAGTASSTSTLLPSNARRSARSSMQQRDVLAAAFNVQPDEYEGPMEGDAAYTTTEQGELDEELVAGSGSNTRPGETGESGTGTREPGSLRPFRFLSVFKWEMRKGWDMLLRAYFEEFRGVPDVELHIVTKPFFEKVSDWPAYFRKQVGPLLNITHPSQWDQLPRVVLHHRHVPESLYPRVYSAMDALVIPTRGEGWGRPQIEAMSMGLPVISTNWSGLTAFLDSNVAYPIRVQGVVPVQDSGPNSFEWFQGQRWAQPDEQHLRQLMRRVFIRREEAATKGRLARRKVLEQFSERMVAHQLLAQLLRLQDVVGHLLGDPVHAQQQQQRGAEGLGQQSERHVRAGGAWRDTRLDVDADEAPVSDLRRRRQRRRQRRERQLRGDVMSDDQQAHVDASGASAAGVQDREQLDGAEHVVEEQHVRGEAAAAAAAHGQDSVADGALDQGMRQHQHRMGVIWHTKSGRDVTKSLRPPPPASPSAPPTAAQTQASGTASVQPLAVREAARSTGQASDQATDVVSAAGVSMSTLESAMNGMWSFGRRKWSRQKGRKATAA